MTQNTDNDNGWLDQITEKMPEAEAAFTPGMTFEPHDGETTDVNLHLHDLLAEPNPNVPDPMADYTADQSTEDDLVDNTEES